MSTLSQTKWLQEAVIPSLKSEATKFLKDFKFENKKKPEIDKSILKLSDVRKKNYFSLQD
jgi:hypothetical protein